MLRGVSCVRSGACGGLVLPDPELARGRGDLSGQDGGGDKETNIKPTDANLLAKTQLSSGTSLSLPAAPAACPSALPSRPRPPPRFPVVPRLGKLGASPGPGPGTHLRRLEAELLFPPPLDSVTGQLPLDCGPPSWWRHGHEPNTSAADDEAGRPSPARRLQPARRRRKKGSRRFHPAQSWGGSTERPGVTPLGAPQSHLHSARGPGGASPALPPPGTPRAGDQNPTRTEARVLSASTEQAGRAARPPESRHRLRHPLVYISSPDPPRIFGLDLCFVWLDL